jgi:nicotinate-nucleotide pyrophosphorylase
MNWLIVDKIIKNALIEDMPQGDVTTECILLEDKNCAVDIILKEDGVICGLEVFARVFDFSGGRVATEFFVKEGDFCKNGTLIGTLKGSVKSILSGERTALNIMQRMSGIATTTKIYCDEVAEYNTKILDTRKTTPCLRMLEKYATKTGGATNHRFNLSDGVMIKDNHIKAAGGIQKAVSMVRASMPFVRMIEVEVESLQELEEALSAKADIIMLDNMNVTEIIEAVRIIDKRALTEVSGNMTLERLKPIAATGVDYISVGKLTHSYSSLDISMKNLRYVGD